MVDYKHSEISEKIIGAAYDVHNTLGSGFLEKVYQNALIIELMLQGLSAEAEKPITVHYRGEVVGNYIADIVVEDKIIVEVKAINSLSEIHEVQLVNYLTATGIDIGLLLNFGKSVEVKRRIKETNI
ncbi:MAG TPA: GxxExxY protein [Methanosarcinaceae archaeon]|nr:GxxExxY protein [Methanosarcinaceae archaeon]